MNIEELKKRLGQNKEVNPDLWHRHPNGGGWVENTAHVDKTAIVEENAVVYDNARVTGDAGVCDNAMVYGNAILDGTTLRIQHVDDVCGYATVAGDARVFEEARVSGAALVLGSAQVFGTAEVNDWACVSEAGQVFGSAKVCDNATIGQQARVSGSTIIAGRASIRGDAWIRGKAEIKDGVYIDGSVWDKTPCYHKDLDISHSREGHSAICEDSRPHEFWLSEEGAQRMNKRWGLNASGICECRAFIQKIMASEKQNQKIAQFVRPKPLVQKTGIRMG